MILFLFSCHYLLPLKHTVVMIVMTANLLWAMGTRKSIGLPLMMFMSLCVTYNSSDPRGSVPFTGFLKRQGIHIPVDLIKIDPENPIDRYSLTLSKG